MTVAGCWWGESLEHYRAIVARCTVRPHDAEHVAVSGLVMLRRQRNCQPQKITARSQVCIPGSGMTAPMLKQYLCACADHLWAWVHCEEGRKPNPIGRGVVDVPVWHERVPDAVGGATPAGQNQVQYSVLCGRIMPNNKEEGQHFAVCLFAHTKHSQKAEQKADPF